MLLKHVLRIQQRDDPKQYVLLNVSQNKEDSLDLTIEGTDGDSPFVGKVQQSRLSKLLVKDGGLSLTEWEAILYAKLLKQRKCTEDKSADTIELVAHVQNDQLGIAFRKNIEGYAQRIGEIILRKDEDHEIDTILWISTAVAHSSSVEQQVQELSQKLEAHEKALGKLRAQLQEFQQAKKNDEAALLDKFCECLNFKKAKIRDQQRLLASAQIDKAKAVQLQSLRASSVQHDPSSSRRQKRKSVQAGSTSESDFESMDVDKDRREDEERELSRMSTPDREMAEESDPDTALEDLDDLGADTSASLKDKAATSKSQTQSEEDRTGATEPPARTEPPPRRALPFEKKVEEGTNIAARRQGSSLEKGSIEAAEGEEGSAEDLSDDEL